MCILNILLRVADGGSSDVDLACGERVDTDSETQSDTEVSERLRCPSTSVSTPGSVPNTATTTHLYYTTLPHYVPTSSTPPSSQVEHLTTLPTNSTTVALGPVAATSAAICHHLVSPSNATSVATLQLHHQQVMQTATSNSGATVVYSDVGLLTNSREVSGGSAAVTPYTNNKHFPTVQQQSGSQSAMEITYKPKAIKGRATTEDVVTLYGVSGSVQIGADHLSTQQTKPTTPHPTHSPSLQSTTSAFRTMPASPKARVDDDCIGRVKLLSTGGQQKIISSNHFKPFISSEAASVSSLSIPSSMVDVKCSSVATALVQAACKPLTSTCQPTTTYLMSAAGTPYTLLNSSSPGAATNVVVKGTGAAGGAVGVAKPAPGTTTHVQYLVPSVTIDGKLVLQTTIGTAGAGQSVRVLTSSGVDHIPTAAGVIKLNNKQQTSLVVLSNQPQPSASVAASIGPTSQLHQGANRIKTHG